MYSQFFEQIEDDVAWEIEQEWEENNKYDDDDDDDDGDESLESDQRDTLEDVIVVKKMENGQQQRKKEKVKQRNKNRLDLKNKKREKEEMIKQGLARLRLSLNEDEQRRAAISERERDLRRQKRMKPKTRIEYLDEIHFGGSVRHCFESSLQLIPFITETEGEEEKHVLRVVNDGLVDFAMSLVMGSLYIHGGKNRHGKMNHSTLKFDPVSFAWSVVNDAFYYPITGHYLGQIQDHLLAFDTKKVYTLELSPDCHSKGTNWKTFQAKGSMIPVSHFASFQVGPVVFIHGGVGDDSRIHNQFVKLRVEIIRTKPLYDFNFDFSVVNLPVRPSARYKHSATCVTREISRVMPSRGKYKGSRVRSRDTMFVIFGGIEKYDYVASGDEKYLNDMWAYNIDLNGWLEVMQDGVMPPPMHSFSMWTSATDQKIYIYGGVYRDEESMEDVVSDAIYIFEFHTSHNGGILRGSWKVMEAQNSETQQFATKGHKTVLINSKIAATFGADHNDNDSIKCTALYGIGDAGIVNETTRWLWECVERGIESDITIKISKEMQTKDETDFEFDFIRCHRCILSARSHKFDLLIAELDSIAQYQIPTEDALVLEIDNYSADVVRAYVQFLYTATINLSLKRNVEQLVEMAKEYGHHDVMEQISFRHSSASINLHAITMKQLKHDFLSLMDNESTYTDARISPSDGDDIEGIRCAIPVHRVMITRVPHIQRCFVSGLEESVTGNIHFEDIDEQTLRAVLHYLYTGEVRVDVAQIANLFMTSKMLELHNLHNYTSRVLLDFMTDENAFDILFLVETHNEENLRQRCIEIIANKDELLLQVENHPDFFRLTEVTKLRLQTLRLDNERKKIQDRRRRELREMKRREREKDSPSLLALDE